jgi:hypothetical protein
MVMNPYWIVLAVWVLLLVAIVIDAITSHDLKWWMKALWTVFIFSLPFWAPSSI